LEKATLLAHPLHKCWRITRKSKPKKEFTSIQSRNSSRVADIADLTGTSFRIRIYSEIGEDERAVPCFSVLVEQSHEQCKIDGRCQTALNKL
jgi:hypothetical protein